MTRRDSEAQAAHASPRRRRWLRVAALAAAALVATGCGAWLLRLEIAGLLLDPGFAFDARPAPPAPDYARDAAWAALPERSDDADVVPAGQSDGQASAAADAFFLHPTTYWDDAAWNQPLDDARANEFTDRRVLRSQASAFNACCRVHAPRYRQATLFSFMTGRADGQRARDLAYADVASAFDAFLARTAPGRPILLAAHSQGSHHLLRLLEERFAQRPLAERLVAAYAVGVPLPADKLDRTLHGIPLCATPASTGCLVSWNTVAPDADRTRFWARTWLRYPGGWESNAGKRLACVNPLSWRADEAPAGRAANLGAVILPPDAEAPPAVEPGVTGARCDGGLLVATDEPPRRFRAVQLARGDYHLYDYSLFWANVRRNAVERVRAFVARR